MADLGFCLPSSRADVTSSVLGRCAAALRDQTEGAARDLGTLGSARADGHVLERNPPLLYDYYGFPQEAYALKWPAPGNPVLAARVRELLAGAGFSTAEDAARGYDHGTFVPLKVAFPAADIPAVQLSLIEGLDADEHLKMGHALAPLRDEGVLIVGTGNTFHNLSAFRSAMQGGGQARERAAQFDAWLQTAVSAEPNVRDEQLRDWARAPFSREAHPREEHLIPLLVVAGAAGADPRRHELERLARGLPHVGISLRLMRRLEAGGRADAFPIHARGGPLLAQRGRVRGAGGASAGGVGEIGHEACRFLGL